MHTSRWPILLAGAVTLGVLGLIWPVLIVPGVFLVGMTVTGWVREVGHHELRHPRPYLFEGAPASVIVTWLIIASELFLFGALFTAHFYLRGATGWPAPGAPVPSNILAGAMTVVLLSSGWTAHRATDTLRAGEPKEARAWLVRTLVLGVAFLGMQAYEYWSLIGEGLTLSTATTATTFFVLTATHGLHVFAGVFVLAIMGRLVAKEKVTQQAWGPLHGAVVYWHFVDFVWIFLYLVLYLRVI